MKLITGTLFIFSLFLLPSQVFSASYNTDFTFVQGEGKVVVVDSFNNIGKSGISIAEIKDLLKENAQLKKDLKSISDKLDKLETGTKGKNTDGSTSDLKIEIKKLQERASKQDEKIKELERKK